MTIEQKIKEIEGLLGNVGILMSITDNDKAHMFRKSLEQALEVIRELQEELEIAEKAEINKNLTLTLSSVLAENTALKARLEPTPEAPEIDKITCLEADVALRDDRIAELEKQLDRVRDTEKLAGKMFNIDLNNLGNWIWELKHQPHKVREYIQKARALQNYILGGEGEKTI